MPELPSSLFREVIERCKPELLELYDKIEKHIYCDEYPLEKIGFPDDKGHTSYYSKGVTKE